MENKTFYAETGIEVDIEGTVYTYDLDCYDGYAIGKLSKGNNESSGPKEITMMYPELADVLADKEMCRTILRYRGLWDLKPSDITYGDIMMCLGEVTDCTY